MTNPTGYTALDLIGFTDKGAYAGNVAYVKNDLVHYGGNVWRCLVDDTTAVTPSEGVNWTLFIGEPTNLVERIIAPLENNPSENAWAVGRQFIFNDHLYEVITAIAIGDSLVTYESDPTNANIKLALPVETQLLALKALDEAIVDIIAPTETSPATAAHAVDEQFFYNDTLYTVIASIAVGDTLTVGTNIQESESIVDQLGSHKGHVIKNSSGTSLTDRTALQFENGYVEDDSVNDKTIVRSTNFVGTLAQWNALAAAEKIKYKTADITDDFNGAPIDSALSDTSSNPVQNRAVKAAIDGINTNLTALALATTEKVALISTSHTVTGYYIRIGNVIVVAGSFIPTSSSSEYIYLNIPNVVVTMFVARDGENGNLVTMYINDNFINTYKHEGTITVGNELSFCFTTMLK